MSETKLSGWILAISVAFFTVALLGMAVGVYFFNRHHFSYVLDDAYIHMAIAKHIAQDGVFGITPYEFSASSSSPLWSFMLAGAIAFLGDHEWVPLVLNCFFGVGVLVLIWMFARRAQLRAYSTSLLLVGSIFLLPMIPIAMTGMEHLLHIFASVAMIYVLWPLLDRKAIDGFKAALPLGLWCAIAVSSRFETMFLSAAVMLALLLVRKWKSILVCAVGTAVPVFGFGLYWMANGQHFLPNSVLLKGHAPKAGGWLEILDSLGLDAYNSWVSTPHLFVLGLVLLVGFLRCRKVEEAWSRNQLLVIIALGGTFLHLQFADVGWFYRYESYLIAISLLVIALLFDDLRINAPFTFSRCTGVVLLIMLLMGPLSQRAVIAHQNTPKAAHNIYHQQYQSGRFIKTYYDGEAIAANDIGAINYLASPRCLDLWGLGSRETMEHHMNGTMTTQVIRDITIDRKVKIALVYPSWFQGTSALPDEWIAVGTLTIKNNVICGNESVTFMAVDPKEEQALLEHLEEFAKTLPEDVTWTPAELNE